MSFKVKRVSYYVGRFPHYNLPYEIGCFSLDAKGKYRNDGHQMKYLSMPDKLKDLCMDLNEGFDKYIFNFEDWEFNYNMILKWILSHQDLIQEHFADKFTSSPKIDFVLFRGPFMAISRTLYEQSEGWIIVATKLRSVIYLALSASKPEAEEDGNTEEEDGNMEEENGNMEKENEKKKAEEELLKRTMTWGLKFEQYMVSDTMDSKPNTSVAVNENEKYFAVFKGKLGDHRLLFSTEFDCVDPKHLTTYGCDATSPLRYRELKTSRIITSGRQHRNFRRYKLLKWYLQSYFAGVPQVICGFRDDEGIVRELKRFNVRDMPKMADGLWSPAACLNFTSHFLDYVKKCVVKDGVRYYFYWKPGSDVITCEEMDKESTFLPEWYTSEVTVI